MSQSINHELCAFTVGQQWGPDGLPERTQHFKDIHVYHTKTNRWSMLNQERELKMEDLPYLMCYRIPPGKEKGIRNYPPPRVDQCSLWETSADEAGTCSDK